MSPIPTNIPITHTLNTVFEAKGIDNKIYSFAEELKGWLHSGQVDVLRMNKQ